MPTYDYYCSECGHKQEAFQKITAEPLKECEECHKQTLVRRPGGGIGLSLSGGGDGFYANMYGKNKPQKETPDAPPSSGGCCPCGKSKSGCELK